MIELSGELLTPFRNIVDEVLRQVLMDAARAEIRGMHAAAGGALIEHAQFFTFFKTPGNRRQRAYVEDLRCYIQQVRHDPAEL